MNKKGKKMGVTLFIAARDYDFPYSRGCVTLKTMLFVEEIHHSVTEMFNLFLICGKDTPWLPAGSIIPLLAATGLFTLLL